ARGPPCRRSRWLRSAAARPREPGARTGGTRGSGTPAVECERSRWRVRRAGAMARGRTFIEANPTPGTGNAIASPGASEVVQRVRDRAVDAHLEVQVRAEAQARAAAVADDLAL